MGKMGAAALSAEAGLRAGVGLLTAHIPQIGYNSMQYGVPEVMVNVDSEADMISSFAVSENHSAVAIGPGIGQDPVTCKTLLNFLTTNTKPLVLDADALNILSNDRHYLFKLHKQTVLTPHPREFDRLFGEHDTSFERFRTLQLKAQELGVVIVLKGAYTRVALPDGTVHFNGSGNPGMATAGSGDVLTGIIGGLLAQGYPADVAARLGVFLHGLSADLLLEHSGPQGITAGDIVRNLGVAWKKLAG
jgi:ADP-dependent NAD(P)H-hydrate dehydratase / NAD(P)H-hydrate epimerase